jgi:hypothetical protein
MKFAQVLSLLESTVPKPDPLRLANTGDKNIKQKLAYYEEELKKLKANPAAYKSHVAEAERMIKKLKKQLPKG